MHISSLDIIGNGLRELPVGLNQQEEADSSIFDTDIDAQTVANLLNNGVNKDKIVEDLVNAAAPSADEELTAVIKNKIENFVNYVQFQIFKNNSQNGHRNLFTNQFQKYIICESSKTISQLGFCFIFVLWQ